MSSVIEEFVLRSFRGKPSEKAILLAAADATDANDCVVSIKLLDLIVRSNVSAREFYYCIATLDEDRWLRRLSPKQGGKSLRVFHFEKFCDYSAKFAEYGRSQSSLCPNKGLSAQGLAATLHDLRNAGNALQSNFLPFPRQGFSADKCELCRGEGFRWIPRPDGESGQMRIRCTHRIATLAGRWEPARHLQLDAWEQDHLLDELRALSDKESGVPAAEQSAFDWIQVKRETHKADLEDWLQKHPEATAKNVVVMKRTA